jgi:hypothetical protein
LRIAKGANIRGKKLFRPLQLNISVEREIRQADEELPKEWKNGQAEEEKSSGTEAPGSDQARCHQSPTCDERRA